MLEKGSDIVIESTLIATRAQPVLDRLYLSGEDYIDPESFQPRLYPHWGILRSGTGDSFLLTERPFNRINGFFWNLPSKLIEFYLDQARGEKITILDVGGGRDAKSAKGIATSYPNTEVINIDRVAINESIGNFTSKRGDICYLDLSDASIDIAYSHQVLPYFSSHDNFVRRIRAIKEVARVLKPGGIGLIDYTNASSVAEQVLQAVDQKLGSLVLPRQKSYGGVFFLIARQPIDSTILNMSAQVPSLAA
jgi:SAM-dependent methyltransferase